MKQKYISILYQKTVKKKKTIKIINQVGLSLVFAGKAILESLVFVPTTSLITKYVYYSLISHLSPIWSPFFAISANSFYFISL